MLGVEVVDHDEIEVRTRRHLARAEPAKRNDRCLLAADAAVGRDEIVFHASVQRTNEHVGEAGEHLTRLLGRNRSRQDARADQKHLLLAKQANGVEHIFITAGLAKRAHQPDFEVLRHPATRQRNSARSADR